MDQLLAALSTIIDRVKAGETKGRQFLLRFSIANTKLARKKKHLQACDPSEEFFHSLYPMTKPLNTLNGILNELYIVESD